mmetsp:Transcript_19274/g.40259  ORF Transcript_19274/g.40259 Transcript_19274/m.40259 type:complete len:220 (-) Transcript_19274:7-666(-)
MVPRLMFMTLVSTLRWYRRRSLRRFGGGGGKAGAAEGAATAARGGAGCCCCCCCCCCGGAAPLTDRGPRLEVLETFAPNNPPSIPERPELRRDAWWENRSLCSEISISMLCSDRSAFMAAALCDSWSGRPSSSSWSSPSRERSSSASSTDSWPSSWELSLRYCGCACVAVWMRCGWEIEVRVCGESASTEERVGSHSPQGRWRTPSSMYLLFVRHGRIQ